MPNLSLSLLLWLGWLLVPTAFGLGWLVATLSEIRFLNELILRGPRR